MVDLRKLNNRGNADLWSHPDIKEYYESSEAPSNTFEMFDPSVPFEERKKTVKELEKSCKESMPVKEDEWTKIYDVPGCPEEPDQPTYAIVTQPKNSKKKKKPCIIFIPCGGLAVCWDFLNPNVDFAERFGAVAVTAHYRTIFDDKGMYPGALNDCHAVFKWVVDNAEELGINPERIVFWGFSSGGHLGLALMHRLKRYGYHGHCPRGNIYWVPVPDERADWPSSQLTTPAWGGEQVFYYARC